MNAMTRGCFIPFGYLVIRDQRFSKRVFPKKYSCLLSLEREYSLGKALVLSIKWNRNLIIINYSTVAS